MTRIVRVHAAYGNYAKLAPYALGRIAAFSEKMDGDADLDKFVAHMAVEMINPQTTTIVMLALSDDGDVVGHLLGMVDDYYGLKYCQIIQLQVDKTYRVDRETYHLGLKILSGWAKALGATVIRAWAMGGKPENPRSRLFSKYGFALVGRTMIEMPIVEDS